MIIHCIIHKEGSYFSAECLELPVATFGSDLLEANSNLKDVINGYLEELDFAVKKGENVRKAKRSFYYCWYKKIIWAFLWYIMRRRLEETPSGELPWGTLSSMCVIA